MGILEQEIEKLENRILNLKNRDHYIPLTEFEHARLFDWETARMDLVTDLLKIQFAPEEVRKQPYSVCAWCNRVRDRGVWLNVLNEYEGEVSHGMCPECYARKMAEVH